jgi:transposase
MSPAGRIRSVSVTADPHSGRVKDDVFFRTHDEARGVVMRDAWHHDRYDRASYQRLDLITGSKRRRARSIREKAAIVAETFAPGANVSEIARRHRLNRGLLFTWRRQVKRARPSPVADATSEEGRNPVFVPVEIEGAVGSPARPTVSDAPSPPPLMTAPIIEIVTGAMTVRVPTGVDAATLATVLATLRALA